MLAIFVRLQSVFLKNLRILFLYFILAHSSLAQMVLDSPFIGDRFLVYNGLINYKIWSIPEFLIHNPIPFSLTDSERVFLLKNKYNFYPSNYLFHEESFWTKRVFKTIDLENIFNKNLLNVSALSEFEDFRNFVVKNLKHPKFDIYLDSSFSKVIDPSEVDSNYIKDVNFIEIKEDWYFNKTNNEMESFILGLGFGLKNEKGKTIKYWCYFPQFKNRINAVYTNSDFVLNLKNRTYFVESDRVFANSYNGMVIDLEYQNDFDAVLEAFLVKDKLRLQLSELDSNAKFKLILKGQNNLIKGSLKNGVLQGKIECYSSLGKLISFFTYNNGVLEGEFCLNYPGETVKQKGNMINGFMEGVVSSYFENGNLLSLKKYNNGNLDGEQIQYYQNQKIKSKYNFSDATLNGVFESFYPDGSLNSKGSISNGLLIGDWVYRIKMPEYLKKIISRNTSYFDQNYVFTQEWTSQKLNVNYIEFKALYTLFNSDECLNKLCSNVEIIE